jgi:hypothetical protein
VTLYQGAASIFNLCKFRLATVNWRDLNQSALLLQPTMMVNHGKALAPVYHTRDTAWAAGLDPVTSAGPLRQMFNRE